MPLPLSLLRGLSGDSAVDAWTGIFSHAWDICSQPFPGAGIASEVTRRDREIAALDLFLAASGWDLWQSFESSTEHTADTLSAWWQGRPSGRAVLILDGLSLRELPWLLQGAAGRGFRVISAKATAAELPAETTPFAKALGFSQRGALENNAAGASHRLPGARTEAVGLPWSDCAQMIQSEPDWVFWHHWPDNRVHDLSVAGQGLNVLVPEAAAQLASDDFWKFVDRLSTGRQLVITSDHGYAASGLFSDTHDDDQAQHLKAVFKSGRSTAATNDESPWVPPVDLTISSRHGRYRYALGRRKWKSQGGYPTLTHGGLSVLEVASPFIEMGR